MALKGFQPITPGRRFMTASDFSEITRDRPERSLVSKTARNFGRNHFGRKTNINLGRGHKRRFREIDFKRDKRGVPAKVVSIEYDPNRTARIALLQYADGEKRYIVAPIELKVGQQILNSPEAEIKPGNCLPLAQIPTGQPVYNIELKPGRGGQLVRSAGVSAQLVAKEGDFALLRMPSGEMRKVHLVCYACIGQVSNPDHQNISIGKAGRSRWLGRRPHNRAVSKNPVDHPMGGGEGKSKGGRHPCTPSGMATKGLKTRHMKRTDKFIVRRRNAKGSVV